MDASTKPLVVILGPTAVGKTVYALHVAYALHAEMESAVPASFLMTEPWLKLKARQ